MDPLNNTFRRTLIRLGNAAARTDEELLGRFIATRDQAAFEELVRRHGPMVFRVCRRVLHHAQDAEDAFQATFIVLAQKAKTVKLLPNWLYGVAQHVASKARVIADKRRTRELPSSETAADVPAKPEQSKTPEWQEILDAELSRLPDKYRAPLVLCYLQGKSNAEAARLLHCEIDAVRKRLSRARDCLRSRLAGRGVALSAGVLATLLGRDAIASAAIRASLVSPFLRGAALLVEGKKVAGISADASALAASVLTALAWGKIKQVITVGALMALVGLAAVTSASAFLAPRTSATMALAMASGQAAAGNDVQGQLQDFANVLGAAASNGNPTNPTSLYYFNNGVILGVRGMENIQMLRILANNNMQVIQQSNNAAVTLGPRTATTQQAIVTAPGTMYILNTATNQVLGQRVPVQMTMIINLTATSVPNTPTQRRCDLNFRAVSVATGHQVFVTGVLRGNSIAGDQYSCSAALLAAAQATPGLSPAMLSGLR